MNVSTYSDVTEGDLESVLEERGAILHGHFLLSSGRHSDVFVQKFRVLEDAPLAERLGELLADRFKNDFDVVASPAVGAVVLGFVTALAAGRRFVFAERSNDKMEFRRGFTFEPDERVLVVEDVVTTGGSVAEVVDVVKALGGDVVGVGALIDRADPSRAKDLGAPLEALVTLPVQSWAKDDCPLCERGETLDDPGSRRLRA
ncbi:MAG: orotate phosphoribosyltransferase [Actinomycetota bacterium]